MCRLNSLVLFTHDNVLKSQIFDIAVQDTLATLLSKPQSNRSVGNCEWKAIYFPNTSASCNLPSRELSYPFTHWLNYLLDISLNIYNQTNKRKKNILFVSFDLLNIDDKASFFIIVCSVLTEWLIGIQVETSANAIFVKNSH